MKLKCGGYVRTEYGEIDKVKSFKGDLIEFEKDNFIEYKSLFMSEYSSITKYSENIIDLIEPDDYINGCRVYEVEEKGVTVYQKTESSIVDYNYIQKTEIKDIVTKEQFNSMKYIVKE